MYIISIIDYECITVLVNVTSNTNTGDVVTRGELRMSEREYVLDHTPPWVNNLLYVCYVCVIFVSDMCQTCVRHT